MIVLILMRGGDVFARVFGILAVYLLVCSFWLTILAFQVSLYSLVTSAFIFIPSLF